MVALGALSASKIAFYAMAGTVLPLLMLAIAVQLRADRVFIDPWLLKHAGPVMRFVAPLFAGASVAFMALGEVVTVGNLYRDKNYQGWIVVVGLAFGVATFFAGAADGLAHQLRRAWGTPDDESSGSPSGPATSEQTGGAETE